MACIPGLLFCPENEDASSNSNIVINTFTNTITIPASLKYGHCRRIDEFDKLDEIGKGSFSTVYECRDKKSGIIYAIKKVCCEVQSGISVDALKEISILNALKHDNIVNLHKIVAANSLHNNYLLLDCYYCSLQDLINIRNENVHERSMVKCIMEQIFCGLCCIHKSRIIHGCLNPQNVKITRKGIVKISGFQNACYFDAKKNAFKNMNILWYMAPELLLQSKEYTHSIDLWAVGCIFAGLVLRAPIFKGKTDEAVFESVLCVLGTPSEGVWPGFGNLLSQWHDGVYTIPQARNLSMLPKLLSHDTPDCQKIISDLLLYDPVVRLDSKKCLSHSYFQEVPKACSTESLQIMLQETDLTSVINHVDDKEAVQMYLNTK